MLLPAPALPEVSALSTRTLTLTWMLRGDKLLVQGQQDVPGLG